MTDRFSGMTGPEIAGALRRIEWRVYGLQLAVVRLLMEEQNMAKTLADVQADVSANGEVVASAVALLNGISQQLKDALASGDPAAVQAIADGIEANTAALAAAVAANTPAAPAPPAG